MSCDGSRKCAAATVGIYVVDPSVLPAMDFTLVNEDVGWVAFQVSTFEAQSSQNGQPGFCGIDLGVGGNGDVSQKGARPHRYLA